MKKIIILNFFLTIALDSQAMEDDTKKTTAPSTPIIIGKKTITPLTPVKNIAAASIFIKTDYVDYPGAANVRRSPITVSPTHACSYQYTRDSFFNTK